MPRKLLLVEDEKAQEQLLLQYCRQEIKAGKYEIIYVDSGENALEKIAADKDHEIELIIADLKMPAAQVDGWELIRTLTRQHIDIKTIVVTAVGSAEDFTEEEKKNVLFFLDKLTSLETLKFLLEFALDIPDKVDINSQKVRFNTLFKVSKDLPSKQKLKLIEQLLEFLNFKELKHLQKSFPEQIQSCLDEAQQRDELKKWLLQKQQLGEIDAMIPLGEVEYFFVDAKLLGGKGPYYYLRWWKDGRLHAKYLPKNLVETMPIRYRYKT